MPGFVTSPITYAVRSDRLDDDDRDDRVVDVLLQRVGDRVAQLDRRLAGRLEVADERQRDLAVRPDLHRLRQLRVLVDLDPELVARAQAVLVVADGRRLAAGILSAVLRRPAGSCRRRPPRTRARRRGQAAVTAAATRSGVMDVSLSWACSLSSDRLTSGLPPRQFTIGRDIAWRFSESASTACVGIAGGADRDPQRGRELVVLDARRRAGR